MNDFMTTGLIVFNYLKRLLPFQMLLLEFSMVCFTKCLLTDSIILFFINRCTTLDYFVLYLGSCSAAVLFPISRTLWVELVHLMFHFFLNYYLINCISFYCSKFYFLKIPMFVLPDVC